VLLGGGYRTTDISEPGTKTVSASAFLEVLHQEMQRTFEHAEKYGWASRANFPSYSSPCGSKTIPILRNTIG